MGEENSCVGQARQDIAAIVNQHTQNLSDYQARDLPWNIERPQIVIEAREGREELERVLKRCPEAKYNVWSGTGILMENAKSAYKDTLYLHESFDENIFGAKSSTFTDTTFRAFAIICSSAKISITYSAAKLSAITITLFDFASIIPITSTAIQIASTMIDLYQAGSFIYMKATNPELQFMTVEE